MDYLFNLFIYFCLFVGENTISFLQSPSLTLFFFIKDFQRAGSAATGFH